MLRVIIVDSMSGRVTLVRAALEDAGYCVVGVVSDSLVLADRIVELQPDVVIADANSPTRDSVEGLLTATVDCGHPMLMLTRTDNPQLLRMALQQGVAAYSVDGLSTALLRSMVELTVAQYELAGRLKSELKKTKNSLEGRRLVDRAKGLLMEKLNISEATAYKMLRDESMKSGQAIEQLAVALVKKTTK